MKIKKFGELFESESIPLTIGDLELLFSKFPDNATSWRQATDELADFYNYMRFSTDSKLEPVKRRDMKTPSEWNTKYKAAILTAFDKLNDYEKKEIRKHFESWFD